MNGLWLSKLVAVLILLPGLTAAPVFITRPVSNGLSMEGARITSGDQDGDWIWQNPLPTGNDLNEVWGSGSSDVFAVGDYGTIVHWTLLCEDAGDNLWT